jgi:hypothetical protein
LPVQREIDALGGGKTIRDWEARFEFAYQECKDENATLVGGVCPTTIKFARYLHRTHKVYPNNLWRTQIMTLGSVAGIESGSVIDGMVRLSATPASWTIATSRRRRRRDRGRPGGRQRGPA